MADTDEQLRAKLDQAMIYAPSKWSAHVLNIAEAYAKAYHTQEVVLKGIEARKRAEAEFGSFLLSLILPSVIGGFLGAIVAGQGKKVVDAIADQASKARWTVAFDTGKTVVADMAKAEVRLTYESLFRSSGWTPSSISPTEFMAKVQGSIAQFVAAAADSLNNSRTGRSQHKYRDVLVGLYYGPFVRDAPEIKDLWTADELAPVLEVFLWVDWANQRDTDYWLKQISRVQERPEDVIKFASAVKELKDLNPILERLDRCHVSRDFVTQGMMALDGYRFLNILWVRQLARHYQGTLLGDILERLRDDSKVPVPIYRRPKSYALM